MEQNPSWETNTFSVSQEISEILRDQNVCRRANNSPTIFHILDKNNLVVSILLGISLASEVYKPTFQNSVSVPSSWARFPACPGRWSQHRVPKRQLIQVSQEECARLREGVPYVKVYRYNPKHLCPKLNGYGDNGQKKVWSSCTFTHCYIPADSLWPCVWHQITTSQQR